MTPMGSGDVLDLPFRIEQWDDKDSRVEELIALPWWEIIGLRWPRSRKP
jgi:hypothetical protein